MGTQDFPLHSPNHETTLNAKPILIFALWLRRNVVKSATLKRHTTIPRWFLCFLGNMAKLPRSLAKVACFTLHHADVGLKRNV